MVMAWIWTGILAVSIFCAAVTGNGSALGAAVPKGAAAGAALVVSMAGSICLWNGVGNLMEKSGISEKLAKFLRPVLGRIFPSSRSNPKVSGPLTANVCANLLGLGNAATPMGIQAAKALRDPARPHVATDELCRLIVLNTASIQLIPGNVAAVRASFGSVSPFDILPAVWITSLASAGMGLLAAWLMGKAARDG